MSDYWRGRKVLVTGAFGFIGSHIAELLVSRGARVTATVSPVRGRAGTAHLPALRERIELIEGDLTDATTCLAACRNQEVIINAAHADGSVAFKRARPAFIFRENMLITLHMLEAARRCGSERALLISSTEVYPPEASVPTPEHEGRLGQPDAATDGYAWSKRMSEFAAELCAREHGMKIAIARPGNIYGPRDSLDSARGRVIPMLIQHALERDDPLLIWGSGQQVRTFLYVEDLARGLLDLVERHPTSEPINFGGEEEICIRDLATLIVRLSGRQVPVICDPSKPAGPLYRAAATARARQVLGFRPQVPLEQGLRLTIEAYRRQAAQQGRGYQRTTG
jgi:GDP-L-fucose synthase